MENNETPSLQLVTIHADEYSHLLDCKKRLADAASRLEPFAKRPRSPIERNEEVAEFIRMRIGTTDMRVILAECVERFGWKQTPSQSAAYRYRERLRKQALGGPN